MLAVSRQVHIVRDFKIQRHISNKNNYCLKSEFLFFQSYIILYVDCYFTEKGS